MPQTFNDEHASRVVAAIQTRIERKLKSNALVQTTWGEVASIDADQKMAGAYLYGETDGAYISGGFRVPETMYLTLGDIVKVAIDYSTGERWVEEAFYPAAAHKKIVVDLKTGQVKLGDGTTAPGAVTITPTSVTAPSLVATTGITTADLQVTDDLTLDDDMTLAAGSVLTWATDVNLFRASADVLRTDDTLEVGADLNVGDDILLAATSLIDWGAGEFDLSRAAANILRLDDARFRVSRVNTTDFTLEVMQTGDAASGWRMDATGKMEWSDGTNAHDVNLYRSGNDVLRTDDTFSVGSSGFIRVGGTSFPGSPTTNDLFYRTDYQMWFTYNGTRWLSATLFRADCQIGLTAGATIPMSATTATGHRRVMLPQVGGSDLWLEDIVTTFFVSGGTALSGSHKWVITGTKNPSATSMGTQADISSGSISVWRSLTQTVDALFDTAAPNYEIDFLYTKTGTPGTLYAYHTVTYRIVAT